VRTARFGNIYQVSSQSKDWKVSFNYNTSAIRYNSISNLLEFCNTYIWQNVSNNFSAARWRFPEVDYSSANNNFGGFHNASNLPSSYAFAALKPDGSIKAWGDSDHGGSGEPTDNDYTKIYSTSSAFSIGLKGGKGRSS
jgi:hypothetical protein